MTSDAAILPLVLLTPPYFQEDGELGLPSIDDNIFARIIRNPDNPDRPKELQCTELLCGILRNVPTFQVLFIEWLAKAACIHVENVDIINWTFETEYGASNKRLDLLLRAIDQNEKITCHLWAVEVKVGAGFHYSSPIESVSKNHENNEKKPVHQLTNYDSWLYSQNRPGLHLAGFVLAKHDMTSKLPKDLKCRWYCLTWSQLADQTQKALHENKFLASELPFIHHFLGFTNDSLRVSRMNKLNLNTVSFINAYHAYIDECVIAVNDLVAPIKQIFQNCRLKPQNIEFQNKYVQNKRSIIYASLRSDFKIWAGIGEDVRLQIECAKEHPLKESFRKELKKTLLANPDSGWTIEEALVWGDAYIKMPLTKLLDIDNQTQIVQDFVRKGIEDLEKIDINAIIDGLK